SAPGEIAKFQEDQHQRLCGRNRRDGEIGAAQAKAEPADRQACERSHDAASGHADPGRDAEIDLHDGGGVGAEPEIGGMSQRKLLGVAAHQVPGDADEGEQEDADEDVDRERAFHHLRQRQEDDGEHHKRRKLPGGQTSHQRILPPPRPFGLNASVNSNIANTTISPESAPTNWMPSDSATPIIRLATSAPMTLPSVPSTTATKAISTNTCPTNG